MHVRRDPISQINLPSPRTYFMSLNLPFDVVYWLLARTHHLTVYTRNGDKEKCERLAEDAHPSYHILWFVVKMMSWKYESLLFRRERVECLFRRNLDLFELHQRWNGSSGWCNASMDFESSSVVVGFLILLALENKACNALRTTVIM